MKSAQSAHRSGSRQNPPAKVGPLKADNALYVRACNALITSFFGVDARQLVELERLPHLVKVYECLASDYRELCDTPNYFRAIQVASLLKKLELPLFVKNAKVLALEKWLAAEADCKEVNARCWDIFRHPFTHSQPELAALIESIQREIVTLLGDTPPDLPDVVQFMKFGPGASTSHAFNEGSSAFKVLAPSAYFGMEGDVEWLFKHTMFKELVPAVATGELPASAVEPEYVDHATVEFVPKSVSEMRTIEVGPSIATFIQNGYDGFIRRRLLLRWGIDLSNQRPNQVLACVGSVMGPQLGSPCTLDLSAASDRVSYGLVALLFPRQWTRTMSWYRAKQVRLPDGTFHTLEKFSSMGNALTFSIQTLIYGAVVRSVIRDRGLVGCRWRCYGDDIIVPYDIYEEVVAKLELLGFQVNQSKSFSQGYFRESCGADYLLGTNVRPFYIKKPLDALPEYFKVLNLIQVTASHAPIPAVEYEALYRVILSAIPKDLRIYGEAWHDPDKCIWTPRGIRRGKILVTARTTHRVPERIGYMMRLLDGYEFTPFGGHARPEAFMAPERVGCLPVMGVRGGYCTRNGVGLSPVMAQIAAYTSPGIDENRGLVIRRSPRRGPARWYIAPEDLSFDPLLVG